ncbi:MAG: YdcF family protein [Candidatus Buchananbacteria bacterium]
MNTEAAIIILGGGLVKNENGHWRTANFNEGDYAGITGDYLRVEAGAYYLQNNPQSLVIASGGYSQFKEDEGAPTLAQVIADELRSLGVPPERIILEDRSISTYTQLLEVAKILRDRGINEATIISNEYHLPRIREFIDQRPELREMFKGVDINIESAEKIVLESDPRRWEKEIKDAYSSPDMQHRIAMEEKGVEDMRKSNYKFR